MGKLNVTLRFLITFIFCLSSSTLIAQIRYKGAPKHQSLQSEILPKSTDYLLDKGLESGLKIKLNKKIDELIEKNDVAGITATVIVPERGFWQKNKGFISRPDNIIVDSSSVFYWASVSKLVTSAIIHQLIVEDYISLEDRLANWFPDIQYAKKITIEQLLNHTNGIYSFNADSTLHFSNESYSSDKLLKISKTYKNLFKPGEYWSYTNTGYLLLALIIEEIESKTFEQVVKERISDALDLRTLEATKEMPSNLALAHNKDAVVPKDSSGPLGAGNIIGSSKDIAGFLSALLTGKIVPIEVVEDMIEDLYPMFDKGLYYGKGIMLYDFEKVNNTDTLWLGHSGGTENYKSIALFDIKSKIIIAVSINENIPAEAVALRLLELVEE